MNDSGHSGRIQPIPDTATDAYWEAAASGRLLLQRCRTTGAVQWYPRAHSIADWSASPDWLEASGRGTIFSYAVVRRAPASGLPIPYLLALVELEEGVLVTANIVGADPDDVDVGMPVRVVFQPIPGWPAPLPQFESAA